jgi:hypothetical protein
MTQSSQQAAYYALGRSNPIVVRDVVNGFQMATMYFWVYSKADKDALVAMRKAQPILLLQEAHTGEQWYVSFDTNFTIEEHNTSPTSYMITADLIQVDPPNVPDI